MKLRQLRENKNIGLNEFARLIGIAPSYLSALEQGKKNNPSKGIMDQIATALDSTVSEVFYSEEGD